MPLLIPTQGTEAWHAAHIGRISSSNAAACLGLSPHCSARKAWRMILGHEVERDNPYMSRGRALEAHAISEYEIETGRLATPTGFWVSERWPFLGASPDSEIGADGLIEAKCLGKLPEIVPIYYRIQCLVQLAVTGRKWVDFWVWTEGGFFLRRIYPSGAEGLVRRLEAWHKEYVVARVEPPRKKPRRRKAA